jgi:hypothetical protein
MGPPNLEKLEAKRDVKRLINVSGLGSPIKKLI